jgi:hypothetical protein
MAMYDFRFEELAFVRIEDVDDGKDLCGWPHKAEVCSAITSPSIRATADVASDKSHWLFYTGGNPCPSIMPLNGLQA